MRQPGMLVALVGHFLGPVGCILVPVDSLLLPVSMFLGLVGQQPQSAGVLPGAIRAGCGGGSCVRGFTRRTACVACSRGGPALVVPKFGRILVGASLPDLGRQDGARLSRIALVIEDGAGGPPCTARR